MTPNDNNKDTENKAVREITADSRNATVNRGRTRVKDTLDLDFDFDFKKKEAPEREVVAELSGSVVPEEAPEAKNASDEEMIRFNYTTRFRRVDLNAGSTDSDDASEDSGNTSEEVTDAVAAETAPETATSEEAATEEVTLPEEDAVTEATEEAAEEDITPEETAEDSEEVDAGIESAEEAAEEDITPEETTEDSEELTAESEEASAEEEASDAADTESGSDQEASAEADGESEAAAESDAESEAADDTDSSGDTSGDDTEASSGDNAENDSEDSEDSEEYEEEPVKKRRFGLVPSILRVPDEDELEDDEELEALLLPKNPFSIKKKRRAVKAAYRKTPENAQSENAKSENTQSGKTENIESQYLRTVSGKAPLMKDNKSNAVARNKAKKSTGAKSTDTKSGTKSGRKNEKLAAGSTKTSKPAKTKKGASGNGGGNGGGGGSNPPDNNSGKKGKKKKKRNKAWIFVRSLVITFISLVILGGIAGGGYAAYVISHAETIHPDKIYDTLAVSTYIYDDKEKLIDEIYYNENRQIITYEQLPDNLKNAFIAIEDKTFWTHKGFNFRRIIGAILERFHGGMISGTSTITQQLARNVFLPEDKSVRSIKRKIIEMYYAYEIEEELSKEEILTAYLNTIYLGYGCYGVDTAARKYFSVNVDQLSLEQCAALAALPQAPGTYQLIVNEKGENTSKIKKGLYANDSSEDRRNLVLQLMYEQGYITADERDAAIKPLKKFIKPGGISSVSSTSAFKDYLIECVKNDLMDQYDLTEEQAVKLIYTKGLRIYSTLDSQAQKVITKEFKKDENFPSTNKKKVEPEAAMVISEVGTGQIKAMVGARKASGQMMFNRATNPRQPGSSIKPLSVYSAALQKSYEYHKRGEKFKFKNTGYDRQGTSGWGNYITVSSSVIDEPMTVNGKTWPLNVTRTYSGSNTFKTAIQKSINTCAVKILAQVGIQYSMDTLERYGITSAVTDTSEPVNDLNLASLALGAMSEGISPLEMSLAYATFPNGGVRNTGICYTRVEDNNGRTILEAKSQKVKVLDKGVAYIMTDVLQSIVTNGIGYPARVDGIKVGGKTGTTDSRYDIWFAGFTPSYSAALWIGTDENVQMDSYSEKAAALWGKIMGQVKKGKKGSYPSMPKNVYRGWDGQYYTTGTAPPVPVVEKKDKGKNGKGKASESKDSGKSSSKDD